MKNSDCINSKSYNEVKNVELDKVSNKLKLD